jgi:hypothetical protein
MLKYEPTTSILSDIDFIQNHYKPYFETLSVLERTQDIVIFSLTPINDTNRHEFLENLNAYM